MGSIQRRIWEVKVGGIGFKDLDCEFTIRKTLGPEPNTCSLQIYNLKQTSRAALESLNVYAPRGSKKSGVRVGKIQTEISAGYDGVTSLLFRGELRTAISTRSGPDWVTTVEGEDGGRAVYSKRITASYPPGTTKYKVVAACASALGVGLGNIADVADVLADEVYASGTVLDGQAAEELRRITRPMKLTWSVQDNALRWLRLGGGLSNNLKAAVNVSADTGMIGSPSCSATGEITVTSLLVPNVTPGGYVVLRSDQYNGTYRIMAVTHHCSTFGPQWYHEMSLLPVRLA